MRAVSDDFDPVYRAAIRKHRAVLERQGIFFDPDDFRKWAARHHPDAPEGMIEEIVQDWKAAAH